MRCCVRAQFSWRWASCGPILAGRYGAAGQTAKSGAARDRVGPSKCGARCLSLDHSNRRHAAGESSWEDRLRLSGTGLRVGRLYPIVSTTRRGTRSARTCVKHPARASSTPRAFLTGAAGRPRVLDALERRRTNPGQLASTRKYNHSGTVPRLSFEWLRSAISTVSTMAVPCDARSDRGPRGVAARLEMLMRMMPRRQAAVVRPAGTRKLMSKMEVPCFVSTSRRC